MIFSNKILINGIEYAVEDSSSRLSVAAINNQILTINDSITGINTSIAAVYTKSEVDTALQSKASSIHTHELSDIAGARKITYGTADPSGGSSGDIYIKYV